VTNGSFDWARDRLVLIGTKLGGRVKNSVLLVAILSALKKFGMSDHPQVVAWTREYTEACGMGLPTKLTSERRMPIAEALASTKHPMRHTPPLPLPLSLVSTASMEDRSDASSAGTSGTYFSSLRSSYNKLRINNPEPAVPGSAPSLPSLKSCGLLESWTHHPQIPSQLPPDNPGMSEPPNSPTPPWVALRMATNTPKDSTAGPSETSASSSTSSRGTKSTMPVGLDWLAHEQ